MTNKHNHGPGMAELLHELLEHVPVPEPGEAEPRIALEDILERFQRRAFGVFLLIVVLPSFIPVALGVGAISGVLSILCGLQMMWGLERPWIPKFARNFGLPRRRLANFARKSETWFRWLEKIIKPRQERFTGRRADIDFRAKVALFGHMGIEANPADMNAEERSVLSQHIALYKIWRDTLHSGRLWHLTHEDCGISGQIVVSAGKAIAFAAQTGFAENFNVAPVRLKGLEADTFYQVKLPRPWPSKSSQYLADPGVWENGVVLSGTALMQNGLRLPLTHPESAWIITLERRIDL